MTRKKKQVKVELPSVGTETEQITLPVLNQFNKPTQLIRYIDLKGFEKTLEGPCDRVLNGDYHPGSIPGLDAVRCSCPKCTSIAANGVWWSDDYIIHRLKKKITDFNFKGGVAEVDRDTED